jgi:hypothetical protein
MCPPPWAPPPVAPPNPRSPPLIPPAPTITRLEQVQQQQSGSFPAAAPPPSGAVHALLYHGAYTRIPDAGQTTYDGQRMCTDYFASHPNHQEMIIEPLRRSGAEVVVFFHTYCTCNSTRDDRLVELMAPAAHSFVQEGSTNKIVDSYITVIDLLSASGRHVDFVHMMRFDLFLRVPLLTLNIHWNSLNLPWRAELEYWNAERTTSDLFATMPAAVVASYRVALIWSGTFDAPCCHGAARTSAATTPAQSSSPLHTPQRTPLTPFNPYARTDWIYDAYTQRLGPSSVNFIRQGYFSSTQDMVNPTSVPKDNLFLGVLRDCDMLDEHHCPNSPPPPGHGNPYLWPDWRAWPSPDDIRRGPNASNRLPIVRPPG